VTHTVVPGDTLGGLAYRYSLTVRDLMEMNGLTGTNIRLGQKIKVSKAAGAPAPVSPAPVSPAAALSAAAPSPAPAAFRPVPAPAAPAATVSVPPATVPAATATVPASPAEFHTVAAGDTLVGLAYTYRLKVIDLMEMNGLTSTSLRPGQKLRVRKAAEAAAPAAPPPAPVSPAPFRPVSPPAAAPAPAAPAGIHTVVAGDTLGGLAYRYGLKVGDLMEMNGLSGASLRPGQKLIVNRSALPPGTPGSETIRVAEGDTLYSLARKYNLSVDQLKKMNNLAGDSLRSGQILKVR
jgi:membrane-bound lytic murein transglycosylase D